MQSTEIARGSHTNLLSTTQTLLSVLVPCLSRRKHTVIFSRHCTKYLAHCNTSKPMAQILLLQVADVKRGIVMSLRPKPCKWRSQGLSQPAWLLSLNLGPQTQGASASPTKMSMTLPDFVVRTHDRTQKNDSLAYSLEK